MKIIKSVLRPERMRLVPEQFSWVDQALVQRHLIDRCDSAMAALYLFLVTVADAQGLSYYSAATLGARLHLSEEALRLARQRLIALELVAYQAPLYQVLAIAGTPARVVCGGAPALAPTAAQMRAAPPAPRMLASSLHPLGRALCRERTAVVARFFAQRTTQTIVAGAARLSPHHALKDNSPEHHWGGLMTVSSIYVNLGILLPNWE